MLAANLSRDRQVACRLNQSMNHTPIFSLGPGEATAPPPSQPPEVSWHTAIATACSALQTDSVDRLLTASASTQLEGKNVKIPVHSQGCDGVVSLGCMLICC